MIKKGWNTGKKPWLRSGVLSLTVAVIVAPSLAAAHPPAQAATTAFEQVWQRADLPVQQGVAKRTWLWGPTPRDNRTEPLLESPGGMRQVRYYDKSRMEVNNPNADPKSPWFVTNGLLVVEMISGHMQVGVNSFEPREPAQVSVAGDAVRGDSLDFPPTYAALAGVATIDTRQHRSQPRTGQEVREAMNGLGQVKTDPPTGVGRLPRLQQFESVTGHNIPDVFWAFMNQRGMVYENGQYRDDQLFNWLYAMGYPLTEPYWISIEVGGKKLPVMMQAFQRRILTYNPANAPEWRVEMGNVGMQYHQWRYKTNPSPQPTPGPSGGTPLKVRRFAEVIGDRQFSQIHDPLYVAISTQAEWDALWQKHTLQPRPPAPSPYVDFKTEFVIAAYWGDKPNGCFRLDITGVKVSEKTLTVAVNRYQKDGICTDVLTQPHDFAVVSRGNLSPSKYNVIFMDGTKVFSTAVVTLP